MAKMDDKNRIFLSVLAGLALIVSGCSTLKSGAPSAESAANCSAKITGLNARMEAAVAQAENCKDPDLLIEAGNRAYLAIAKASSVFANSAYVDRRDSDTFESDVVVQLDSMVRSFETQTPDALEQSLHQAEYIIDILPDLDEEPTITSFSWRQDEAGISLGFTGYYLRYDFWSQSKLIIPNGESIRPISITPTGLEFDISPSKSRFLERPHNVSTLILMVPVRHKLKAKNQGIGEFRFLLHVT